MRSKVLLSLSPIVTDWKPDARGASFFTGHTFCFLILNRGLLIEAGVELPGEFLYIVAELCSSGS